MKFADMLSVQSAFQNRMGDGELDASERVQRMSQLTLLAFSEACDMMALLGYKTHHPFHNPDWDNALYEWVDQFKYVMAQAAIAGFSASDIERAFTEKSSAVGQRLDRDKQDLSAQPVVVFDIDGILCEYKDLTDDEMAAGAFTESKPNMLMCSFTRTIQAWGVKVVLVTSRKDYRWRRIALDTEMWLTRNNVACDRLIFAYDKAEAVAGFNVMAAIEDSTKHALAYANAGIDTVLIGPAVSDIHERVTSCSIDNAFGIISRMVAVKMETQYAAE